MLFEPNIMDHELTFCPYHLQWKLTFVQDDDHYEDDEGEESEEAAEEGDPVLEVDAQEVDVKEVEVKKVEVKEVAPVTQNPKKVNSESGVENHTSPPKADEKESVTAENEKPDKPQDGIQAPQNSGNVKSYAASDAATSVAESPSSTFACISILLNQIQWYVLPSIHARASFGAAYFGTTMHSLDIEARF